MLEPKFALAAGLLALAAAVAPAPARAGAPAAQETMTTNASPDNPRTDAGRSPDDLIREGEVCLDNGDASRARDLFESALQLRPDDPAAMIGLGRSLTARRRYVEAEALFRDMEDRHIAALEARLGRARLRSLQGDHEGAKRFYRDVLQADPGNVPARLGLVREAHALGLDRQALPQADNLVLDHPESDQARLLQRQIRRDLAPRLEIEPVHQGDRGGNRVDAVTTSGTFMAEPQTAVRIDLTGTRSRSDCGDAIDCQTMVTPPDLDGVATTDTRVLVAGVASRLLRPLTFEARAGAAQQEPLDGSRRTLLIGDARLRWDVGPRLSLAGATGRRPLLDSAALVDYGIRVDSATLIMVYRLHPEWTVTGWGDLGWYSDGNARQTIAAEFAFHAPIARPAITALFEARVRRFRDDRDFGYLDPIRYDSEILTVRLADGERDGPFYWRVEGILGRQSYDPNDSARAPVAAPETSVHGGAATIGFAIGDRVRLEMSHHRTTDAMQAAPGFAVERTGLVVRVRL